MPTVPLHPATIPEWEAEDLLTGRLSEEVWPATEDDARQMLETLRLDLPDAPQHTDLVAFAGERATPLDEELRADVGTHDYHLTGFPIGIIVPEDRRLVRLRLRLALEAGEGADVAAAYDVFPRTEWRTEEHEVGTVSLDVGKALVFVAPSLGEALGLKLTLPLRHTSEEALVQSTGPMSNPVEWSVTGTQLREGFTPYLILRTPKGRGATVQATLAGELRRSGPLGRLFRARFVSDARTYQVPAS